MGRRNGRLVTDDEFDELAGMRRSALEILGDSGVSNDPLFREEEEQERIEGEVFTADEIDKVDKIKSEHVITDSLTEKAMLRGKKWEDLVATAPFARSNPPSVLQGTLGNQATLTMDPNRAFVESQVAFWAGDDAETGPLTITFAPTQVNRFPQLPPTTSVPVFPLGIARFGTRAFSVQVAVDIIEGCQFTVSGSAAQVICVLPTTPGVVIPAPFPSIQVAGMLSFWPCVKTKPCTFTEGGDPAGITSANIISVPPFARDVVVIFSNPTTVGQVEFQFSTGTTAYTITGITNGSLVPMPLASYIDRIKITATGGGVSTIFHAIFNLGL